MQGSTHGQGLLTQDMLAMLHHEDAGISMSWVQVGHVHNVHISIFG